MRFKYKEKEEKNSFDDLAFDELAELLGVDSARVIVRTLEQFEGISESHVARLSDDARFDNVIAVMKDTMRYHTMH